MMATKQVDNSTFTEKVTLRRKALTLLDEWGVADPVVMETHGGEGHLFDACYSHLDEGVVFEKDPIKVTRLARQRETWAVYKADCIESVRAGAGKQWVVDLLDTDPYGSCWDIVDAFFSSERPFAERMVIAVNCGLRQKLASGSGWEVKQLEPMVRKYGANLHPIYLDLCREMLALKCAEAGYEVSWFNGYYCGHAKQMTHFLATLEMS